MVVYTETHTWSENTKLWNSQLQMGTFILYPMFPRLRDHFGKGNVEDKRQGSGYDSSKFTVAVVACTRPRQSKFQMVEGESHQDPPHLRTYWQLMTDGEQTVGFPQRR